MSREDGRNREAIEVCLVSVNETAEDVSILSSAGGRDAEYFFEEATSFVSDEILHILGGNEKMILKKAR